MNTPQDISPSNATAISGPAPAMQSPPAAATSKMEVFGAASHADPIPINERARLPASGSSLLLWIAVADLAIIFAALAVAWWVRFEALSQFGNNPLPGALSFQAYLGHFFIGTAIMIGCLIKFNAYNFSLLLGATQELKIVFRATFWWLLLFLGLLLALRIEPNVSRLYALIAAGCIFLALSYWRTVLANYLLPPFSGSWRRKAIVVGWNEDSQKFTSNLLRSRSPELEIEGILLPEGTGREELPSIPGEVSAFEEGALLEELLTNNRDIDSVFVTELPPNKLNEIAALCEREMVSFQMIPSCFPSLLSGLNLSTLYGVPVLGVNRLPLQKSFNIHFKRAVDIVGSIVGLVLSAPVILFFGVLIYLESRGPVFYRQTRLGLKGRHFSMYKLRSMRLDSEKDGKAGWTVKDDPRCLKIGKVIRSWNLDELPQFWNVLKGEMSLVGPRPERPELIADFKGQIPNYNARHAVKPGLTGWAQVNGLRGDTDLTDRIRYDLHYIEAWSIWFDFCIIFRTCFTRKGAC